MRGIDLNRNKLVELVAQALDTPKERDSDGSYPAMADHITDYLISHGVVVPVRCENCKLAKDSENNFDWDITPLKECDICTIPNRRYEYCSWGEEKENKT